PRELVLRGTAAGLRLAQRPVRELQTLRGPGQRLEGATLARANAWLAGSLPAGELLELRLDWDPAGPAGLDLVTGPGEVTTLAWTPADRHWRLDRTRSGRTDFHPRFSASFVAPSAGGGRGVHLLLDTSSAEFFLDDGETVFTALILPQPGRRRVVLKGGEGTAVKSLEVWPLQSAWRGR
ncbi:MAG TPA: GH32 C-terminal domain-containing protein, partial [Verrucomicrobiota bacterium]|nr:GH32 C-terminal domain-containing protein [Verrucomicrobiota bacterium]